MEQSNSTVTDNFAQQKDELEALTSIYGPEFTIENEYIPTFSIVIPIGDKEGEEVTLVISFSPDYPSNAPPTYQLSVPWIRGPEKQKLTDILDQVYLENIGQPIVYQWVEKLREILLETKDRVSTAQQQNTASVETMNLDPEILPNLPAPKIITGEPLTDRKSTFQAHVARVSSVQEVKLVLATLLQNKKISSATHNMYSYRIQIPGTNNHIQDAEDDGETHAGGRLLHLLQILNCQNVVIIVSRWYGGIMLYGDRFKHINNVARGLLEKEGYIQK